MVGRFTNKKVGFAGRQRGYGVDFGMRMKNIKIYSLGDFPAYLPKLNLLYDDLFSGGKGLRSRLVALVGDALDLKESTVMLLCQTIEFIHNASLLHDDLIDRSPLRRNRTTAWLKYTPEYAVLAGDYLLARVMVNLAAFGNLELIQLTSQMISDLLEGEWIQDSLVRDWEITLEDLDRVHNLKTGSLFKWCLLAPFVAVGSVDSEVKRSLENAGTILGQLFQRGDDLLDFDVRNSEKKMVLGDLKAGYLNSFGVFLSGRLSGVQKQEFLKSQSMSDVFSSLGESYFQDRLCEFDRMNTRMIALYGHHVMTLKGHLCESGMSLIENLLELPQNLYWRKR